jgi:AmiR/NasT family two-component response regulator
VSDPHFARLLRAAKLCRIRDLEQLVIVSDLVEDVSTLIHALQKERGASSIFLGSNGAQFRQRLAERSAESRTLEENVRALLETIDDLLDRPASGARFFTRVALSLNALRALEQTRGQIGALAFAPQDAIKAFSDTIGELLALVFEIADIAADPEISRAMIALVNFLQGKEFAGQERATAGAAFSFGFFEVAEQRRLRQLIDAQEQAFRIFGEFAAPAHGAAFKAIQESPAYAEVERMRAQAFSDQKPPANGAEKWFEQATLRIDAMKARDVQMSADLKRLCISTLAFARSDLDLAVQIPDIALPGAPIAVLVTDADPTRNDLGAEAGVGLYTLGGVQPKLMRSMLDVLHAQSRRLHDLNNQLETAKAALNERKVIDRAKGLLMTRRNLSEQDAYALLRKTAMDRNKRIFEIAEALVSMADMFPE